jgi:hypothetical protein
MCTCSPPRNIPGIWRVAQRECNHSAFNGYHRTASRWSAVVCLVCGRRWRTKAAYVASLPDLSDDERTTMWGVKP